ELLVMINSMLYATNIDGNEIQRQCDRLFLEQFLADIETFFALRQHPQITLVFDYPPDLPAVQTDQEKLEYILRGLIDNAIKFTDNGQVTVSARVKQWTKHSRAEQQLNSPSNQNEALVEFKVQDSGIGIPEEKLPMIFEMFTQADSSETRRHEGVGLGLYIA